MKRGSWDYRLAAKLVYGWERARYYRRVVGSWIAFCARRLLWAWYRQTQLFVVILGSICTGGIIEVATLRGRYLTWWVAGFLIAVYAFLVVYYTPDGRDPTDKDRPTRPGIPN